MLPDTDQILVVDDEANLRKVLAAQLGRDGYEVHTAVDGEAALAFLREHHVDLVITDLRMPKLGGMDLLRSALREQPDLPVIILTAHGTVDTAVEALKTGAFDYISKPFDKDEVRLIVDKALKTRALARQDATRQLPPSGPVSSGRAEGPRFGIIGESTAIAELYAVIDKVADTPSTVLVTGESGTGKELLAETIHAHSARAQGPFVAINCSAIPDELLESELFGHRKGAFTGASQDRQGLFVTADGGTVLLDEIGDMPFQLQAKLLRVLQEGEIRPLGAQQNVPVDLRVISATHVDLEASIRERRFREDLYYRLNVVSLHIPPLRERLEDIPLLADHFLAAIAERAGKPQKKLSPEALGQLLNHDWPGNIRELQNAMERLNALSRGPVIAEALVSQALPVESSSPRIHSLSDARRDFERHYLVQLLSATRGNMTQAAELAGRNRSDFHKLVKRHALNAGDFRNSDEEG